MRCKENLHALQRTFTYVAKKIYIRYKEHLHTLQSILTTLQCILTTLHLTFTCAAMRFDNLTNHFDSVTKRFDKLTIHIYIRYKAL